MKKIEITEEQILECAKVVYDFLCDYTVPSKETGFDTPTFRKMTETLNKYGFDMINFCQFINNIYNLYEEPLWVKTAQEFFSDDFSQPGPSKAKLMLRPFLRDQKLNDILC